MSKGRKSLEDGFTVLLAFAILFALAPSSRSAGDRIESWTSTWIGAIVFWLAVFLVGAAVGLGLGALFAPPR